MNAPFSGAAMLPVQITPEEALRELAALNQKLVRGARRLGEFTEDDLAIATAPADVVFEDDMVRLYKYRPTVPESQRRGMSVLIVYALVGRYQMIDLETDRSFVRKLLGEGIDVYMVDWGHPTRAQRWLTIDDYVSGYLDDCVDFIRGSERIDKVNLIGICQGGVFCTCYAALFPGKVERLVLTVTPLDFHGDADQPETGAGYMNLWARALSPEDIDRLVDTMGNSPGPLVGFAFIMMNPVGNMTKYTIDLLDILDDDQKLLGFLRMERWISDRPSNPGEVVRQWFKDLYQGNKLIRNELVLGGRKVDLGNVTMPVLNVYAQGDVIVPNSCSQRMHGRFGTDDYTELAVPGGHIGTFVGGKAQKILAPSIVRWLSGEKVGDRANSGPGPK
jgi:polyhydroxyalkanoate synthase